MEFCSIAEVRRAADINGDLWGEQIQMWIPSASALVQKAARREIAPGDAGETRHFDIGVYARTREVPVGDLSAAPSAVQIRDKHGQLVGSLTVATDVVCLPRVRTEPWEPYRRLRLRPTIHVDATYELWVTGQWGFPEIPEFVRDATIETVREWLRQTQGFTTGAPDQNDPASRVASRGLPPSALKMLEPLRRTVIA